MKRLTIALLALGCSGPAFEAGSTERVGDTGTDSLDPSGAESSTVDGSGGSGPVNGSGSAETTDSGGIGSGATGGSEPTGTEDTISGSGGTVGTTGGDSVSTTGDQSSSGGAATAVTATASTTDSATVNTVSTASSTATVNTVNTVSTATSTNTPTSNTSTTSTTGGSECECDSTPDPDHENIAARLPDYEAGCCDGCHLVPAWTRCIITAQCFNDYNFEIEWGTCTGESDLCANHGLAANPAMNGGSGISACAGNVSDPEECSETSASTARCD